MIERRRPQLGKALRREFLPYVPFVERVLRVADLTPTQEARSEATVPSV